MQAFFSTVGSSGASPALCIVFALAVLAIMELVKAGERRQDAP